MKVVINTRHGGFGLSHEALMAVAERKGIMLYAWADDISIKHFGAVDDPSTYQGTLHYTTVPEAEYKALEDDVEANDADYRRLNELRFYWSQYDVARDDPDLVAVVEQLGDKANGRFANLKVVEVPDGVQWEIAEYDGLEWAAEVHRTWS